MEVGLGPNKGCSAKGKRNGRLKVYFRYTVYGGKDQAMNNISQNTGIINKLLPQTPTYFSVSLSPVAPILKHRASVKRFVSLQFHNPKRVSRTSWTGDKPVARPLPMQTQNKHRQTSIPLVGFEPTTPDFEWAKTIHALHRAATVTGSDCCRIGTMLPPRM
jgi:hypothetical protein